MATSHAPATATASKSKEKVDRHSLPHSLLLLLLLTTRLQGNAAFKAGDYAAAIGHYTAAALADPSDPTFFLNRAAAYLKLSK
jgi:Flp pilus assembly protein TadD